MRIAGSRRLGMLAVGILTTLTLQVGVIAEAEAGLRGSVVRTTASLPRAHTLAATPAVPTGLEVTAVGDERVRLDWNDNARPFGRYQVYRNGVLVDHVRASEFVDTNVSNGRTYSYRVSAGRRRPYSRRSAAVSATPAATAATSMSTPTPAPTAQAADTGSSGSGPTPTPSPSTGIAGPGGGGSSNSGTSNGGSGGGAAGDVLWKGDFENGIANFQNAPWNYQGAPTPTVASSPVAQGAGSGRFELPVGVGRNELVGSGPAAALSNGQVRYFSWSTYLPSDFVFLPKWRVLAQWKNEGTGSPPLELKLQDGKWLLDGGWNNGSCAEGSDLRTGWSGDAIRGAWTRFVIGIEFEEGTPENPYAGWVELWKDGEQVVQRTPWKTLYRGCTSYLKLGLYRDPTIATQDVVLHDDWKMGTTYDSVAR